MAYPNSTKSRLEKLCRLKGVFVDTVNDQYRGPTLQRWDYFTTTDRASAYVGCETDEVGVCLREGEFLGRGGAVTVKGVRFMPAEFICESFRPALNDPIPPRGPSRLTKEQIENELPLFGPHRAEP